MNICPKCGYEYGNGAEECFKCGIVIDKYIRIRDKKIQETIQSYQNGNLSDAEKACSDMLSNFPGLEEKIKPILKKIEKEKRNFELLNEAGDELKAKRYLSAKEILAKINTDINDTILRKEELLNKIEKKINAKSDLSKPTVRRDKGQFNATVKQVNKNRVFYVLTPISLFIVLLIVGFLFFKTEQKVIFIAEKISYREDTGSLSCQLECSERSDSGPVEKYIANGWQIVSSAQKSIIAEDFHVEKNYILDSIRAYGCECIGHEYILTRKLIDKIF